MANKSDKPVNIYSLLADGQNVTPVTGDTRKGAAPAAVVGIQQTPAERAAARNKANAEKNAAAEAAKEAAEKDAQLAKLLGPMEGFVTQKGSQPKKDRSDAKKLSRQEYETQPKPDPSQRKERQEGSYEKKPYVKTEGSEKKQYAKADYNNQDRRPHQPSGHQGQGNRPPRRENDKHSAGKTGNKFQPKRDGEGKANWGNAQADPATTDGWGAKTDKTTKVEATATWGDEGEPKADNKTDAAPSWGDEGEPKAEKQAFDPETADDVKTVEKDTKPREPAWDDEGFNKHTLGSKEYEEAEKARQAQLASLIGQKERRTVDAPADMSKFVVKDTTEEKYELLKKEKKAKKAAAPARAGEKPVAVNELFSVRGRGAGGRGRGRPDGSDGERAERGERGERGERPPRQDREGVEGGRGRGGQRAGPAKVQTSLKQFPSLPGTQQQKPQAQPVK